jgi:ribosome-associated translation inhibitor RaiA
MLSIIHQLERGHNIEWILQPFLIRKNGCKTFLQIMSMQIHIRISPTKNVSALQAFVEDKASKLDQFLEEIIRSDIALIEDESAAINNKICMLTVRTGKRTLTWESRSVNFERATLEAIQGIIRQFKRMQAMYR